VPGRREPAPYRAPGRYPADLIEVAIEVVSPTNARNDYKVKDERYAAEGIANYLIFDPYRAQCITLWNPGPDGYRGRDTIPYGKIRRYPWTPPSVS
jgi:Uma2 family endonuclease